MIVITNYEIGITSYGTVGKLVIIFIRINQVPSVVDIYFLYIRPSGKHL